MEIAVAQRKQDNKTFKRGNEGNEGPPEFPCTMDKVHALLDTWIRDKEIVLPGVEKLPTQEEKSMLCIVVIIEKFNTRPKNVERCVGFFTNDGRMEKSLLMKKPLSVPLSRNIKGKL